MIHTADTKVARRYGDFFIRQIQKLDEVTVVTESLICIMLSNYRYWFKAEENYQPHTEYKRITNYVLNSTPYINFTDFN